MSPARTLSRCGSSSARGIAPCGLRCDTSIVTASVTRRFSGISSSVSPPAIWCAGASTCVPMWFSIEYDVIAYPSSSTRAIGSNDGDGSPGKTGMPLRNACVRSTTRTREVFYARRTLGKLVAAHLVDRGAAALVHGAPALVGVGRFVDRPLAGLELVAVLPCRLRLRELRAELVRRVRPGARHRLRRPPPRAVGGRTAGEPGDPREQASH